MNIGIDLGGSNIRMATVEQGKIITKISEPCQAKEEETVVINQLKRMISKLMTPTITKIGIGVPSVVDTKLGIIYDVMNIPSWKEVHLKDILEAEFNIPVQINNDCNCFVYGEFHFGNGHDFHDMVGITLGTGLGCGIVINDLLYNGANTGAGEICAIPYLDKDYEFYCSTPFFQEQYKMSGKEAYLKALEGDYKVLDIWSEYGAHLGNLLKTILLVYDPPCVVLGGSLSKAQAFYEESMYQSLTSFIYPKSLEKLQLYTSNIEDAAILGATML